MYIVLTCFAFPSLVSRNYFPTIVNIELGIAFSVDLNKVKLISVYLNIINLSSFEKTMKYFGAIYLPWINFFLFGSSHGKSIYLRHLSQKLSQTKHILNCVIATSIWIICRTVNKINDAFFLIQIQNNLLTCCVPPTLIQSYIT